MTSSSTRALAAILLTASVPGNSPAQDPAGVFRLTPTKVSHELKSPTGQTILHYMTRKPPGSKLTANSTCCLYPVFTPGGIRVVDFAPDDHPHHRGIFLAWHNIQGMPGGDFWGWGEFAPTEGRVIRNKSVSLVEGSTQQAVVKVQNEWLANEMVIINEALTVKVRARPEAYLLDLHYALTPTLDLTLGQSAFSGFNVKSRKSNGNYTDPDGPVKQPHPHHLKPETDWPARPWYDYTFVLPDQTTAGVSVIDHKDNPNTLWHNLLPIAMLNPCIVAPAEVPLPARKTLHLRYRLVVHDGPLPRPIVEQEAEGFARDQ